MCREQKASKNETDNGATNVLKKRQTRGKKYTIQVGKATKKKKKDALVWGELIALWTAQEKNHMLYQDDFTGGVSKDEGERTVREIQFCAAPNKGKGKKSNSSSEHIESQLWRLPHGQGEKRRTTSFGPSAKKKKIVWKGKDTNRY